MKNESIEEIEELKFDPPKFPIFGLIGAFFPPSLILFLHYLFNANKDSTTAMIIIALALLSVLLFILVIYLFFNTYGESYSRQVLRIQLFFFKKEVNLLEVMANELKEQIATLQSERNELINSFDNLFSENEKIKNKLDSIIDLNGH